MQVHHDTYHGQPAYLVTGRPINGHDWRFLRRPGALVVLRPTPDGDEVEIPWEPSSPDEQMRINGLTLFEAAARAYDIAIGSER